MSSDRPGHTAAGAADPPIDPDASDDTEPAPPAGPESARRPPEPSPTVGDHVRTVVRGIGQTAITAGAIILLFVAYELWFTDYLNERAQKNATDKLEQAWNSGDDPLVGSGAAPGHIREIPLGTSIAIIRIPRLGLDYARTIVEGTNADDLAIGPGHYVGTAVPGAVGNFALAGHRVGKGSPFLDVDKLRPGDAIVIETKNAWYTYRMLGANPQHIPGQEIVDPSDVNVIAPVPDHPAEQPTQAMITLTSCHPKFSARERMIIHGVLAGPPRPKSQGEPPALQEAP
jgi:sortase A